MSNTVVVTAITQRLLMGRESSRVRGRREGSGGGGGVGGLRFRRLFVAGVLLAAASMGCEGAGINSPVCTVSPESVLVNTSYAVNISEAGAGQTLTVRVTNAVGDADQAIRTNGAGEATLNVLATSTGTSVIALLDGDGSSGVILGSCVAHISDSTGCGDAICSAYETCEECSDDCGACSASCGDGSCNGSETCTSCELDCGACTEVCGDGTCNLSESCQNCPQDCGQCNGAQCGSNGCETGENCTSCPQDCGQCPASCGDHTCNGGETCTSCPGDCGVCPPSCGDLLCNGSETCDSCPGDCGTCGQACEPPSNALPNGRHKAGQSCRGCHSEFSVAGTLYSTAAGGTAVSGATIIVTDANGVEHKLITASNGNFYTTTNIPKPIRATATKCPSVRTMNDAVSNGSCNACHTAGNRIYLN